eukprot:scaffold114455_cov66-Phaeocystis_antarctica.AAC.4
MNAAHRVDLAVKHYRGMAHALLAHARHQSPRAELRVVGLDRLQCRAATPSTDRIDLATDRGQPQSKACSGHVGQRLPLIVLRVVHLRRVEHLTYACSATHGVELALESDAAVRVAWTRHVCQLRARSVLRVVQLHRALPCAAAFAAHNVDQTGHETRAWHQLRDAG